MKNALYSIWTLIFLFLLKSLPAQVVTYPPAENITPDNPYIYPSPHYQVRLLQGDKEINDFVYCMPSTHTTNYSETTSWVNFSFEGPIQIAVTKLAGEISFAQVLPGSADVSVTQLNDTTIVFEIVEPGHYSVEFEDGIFIEHPLLIFANPLERDVPSKNDDQVIWFEKGYHEIGTDFEVTSGQTVYLEGGAYLKGQIQASDVENVTIRGRGIMSGEGYPPRTQNHMINMRNARDVEIEGITMIHSPRYMIALRGKDHYLHHIKMMGWWFSTDGISAGEQTLIEDCFFKVNDDAVKLYQSDTHVRNCTIWQLENGAPFMISWNGSNDFGNIHVENIDIIRVEHHWDNENLAVICAVHGGEAHISDFLIEDIRIDNSKWRMFHLVTRPNRWGKWNPEKGSISNFTFRNITYTGNQEIPSLIMGHDQKHPMGEIAFEKIMMNGERLTEFNREEFIIDDETTYDITIK